MSEEPETPPRGQNSLEAENLTSGGGGVAVVDAILGLILKYSVGYAALGGFIAILWEFVQSPTFLTGSVGSLLALSSRHLLAHFFPLKKDSWIPLLGSNRQRHDESDL